MNAKPAATENVQAPSPARAADARRILPIGLPSPDTKRWVIRRKATVVAAVAAGVISLEEACCRYGLSPEEFLTWQRLVEAHGLPGLRVTRLKEYRSLRIGPMAAPAPALAPAANPGRRGSAG